MESSEQPRKRAGNKQRDAIAQSLTSAMGDGQLSPAEFDERTRLLWSAKYEDELAPLTADLNLPDTAQPAGLRTPDAIATPSHSQSLSSYTAWSAPSRLSFAMMGSSAKRGDWIVSSAHTSLTIMGETVVDFRNARLTSHETTVHTFTLMGEVTIIVPEHVRVLDDGAAIMGEFVMKDHSSVTLAREDVPLDAPVLRVRGAVLMGEVKIIRAANGVQV